LRAWQPAFQLDVVRIATNQVGSFDLEVATASGGVFDRHTFDVIAPTSLGIATAWATPGLALVGVPEPAHAITRGPAGEILRGTGAVAWSLDGVLAMTDAPSGDFVGGDSIWFRPVDAGSGHVTAVAGSLREVVTVTGITSDEIDELELGVDNTFRFDDGTEHVRVHATARRQGAPVAGIDCSWTGLQPLSQASASLLGSPSVAYDFPKPLTATQTSCRIAGGLMKSIVLPP
jgi:hypothetical protein